MIADCTECCGNVLISLSLHLLTYLRAPFHFSDSSVCSFTKLCFLENCPCSFTWTDFLSAAVARGHTAQQPEGVQYSRISFIYIDLCAKSLCFFLSLALCAFLLQQILSINDTHVDAVIGPWKSSTQQKEPIVTPCLVHHTANLFEWLRPTTFTDIQLCPITNFPLQQPCSFLRS